MNAMSKTENQPAAVSPESERSFVAPDVNIYETETGYLLQADMPGVSKDNLEITLEGNTITIAGHRADRLPDATFLHREIHPVSFRRSFELDPAINTARIQAQTNQGVVTLDLPKAEAVKPQRIKVE